MRTLFIIIVTVFTAAFASAQDKETRSYFDHIKAVVRTAHLGNDLVYRLDTLQSKFIPSRSYMNDYFNRDIDLGYKHRRITMRLNFVEFQVDMLCRNDTIFLAAAKATYPYKNISYDSCNRGVIDDFLKKRNKLYGSASTSRQLVKEITLSEEYAFYCGDGDPKTKKGIYIERLVEEEDIDALTEMLKSFNCETQAYGVAGLNMLERRDYDIPFNIQQLITRIKKRNAELVTCSGCISGVVGKIYSKK